MPAPLWRQNLQPASYSGALFHVDTSPRQSGRRLVRHEFPRRDIPWAEDMGRRIRAWQVMAYIIYSPVLTPDYQAARDALIAQLEAEGSGTLILPTGLQNMSDEPPGLVCVDTYSVTETRERGGYAEFDITFVEAGQQGIVTTPAQNTQALAAMAAQNAISQFPLSTDITALSNPANGVSMPSLAPSSSLAAPRTPAPAATPLIST